MNFRCKMDGKGTSGQTYGIERGYCGTAFVWRRRRSIEDDRERFDNQVLGLDSSVHGIALLRYDIPC